jgi:ketosteroid isomerase-like protein
MNRSPQDLLDRYHAAMLAFSADEFADLYADAAVHEFPFRAPGGVRRLAGRESVREHYRRAWDQPLLRLEVIESEAVHQTSDPGTVVDEWRGHGFTHQGDRVELSGLLVLTVVDGEIAKVRDYMDAYGLLSQTGRLTP